MSNIRSGIALVAATRRKHEFDEIEPEMCLYRNRTTALLRKYCILSMELGRVPSLLGREFFRSKVTSYRMSSFEDVVIFVYDVERCLEKLDKMSQQLIARIAMQEYTYREAAALVGYSERTVERRYPEALDRLSSLLLQAKLLRESEVFGSAKLPPKKNATRVEACQESKKARMATSG